MIYVASPYLSSLERVMQERYEQVASYCARAARAGLVVYSPIAHWHPIAKQFDLPRGHEYWQFHDHEMISLCEKFQILKLDRWEVSAGVARDRAVALSCGKEIEYVEP